MSGRSFSRAVGVGDGMLRRSSVWRVWTNYKRSTVYVALAVHNMVRRGRFKATFAPDGAWRLAQLDEVFRWDRPGEFRPGWTFAIEIVIPNSEVVPPFPGLETPATEVRWCPMFDGDGDIATAFQVFLSARDVPLSSTEWPGNDGSGEAELLARARLRNGETTWLVRAKGEIVGDLRPQLEEARHNEVGRILDSGAPRDADAAVGWTAIKRAGKNGQLRIFELAWRTFRSAQLLRDELERYGQPPGPPTEAAIMALRLTALLEDVFGHDWLKSGPKKHPAVQQWRACRTLMDQQGWVGLPAQSRLIQDVAAVLLDAAVLTGITGGELDTMSLGDIRGFGDAAVVRKIGSRVRDGPQWQDLMVELEMAAWYLRKGIIVTPLERDGFPDLRLEVDSGGVPTFIECKRLRTLSANRVGQVIKKANNQIKIAAAEHAGPYSGEVVLDASDTLGFREGSSEVTPAEISRVEAAAAAALSGDKNRSIRQALIVWSYYRYIVPDETSDGAAAMFVVRAGRYIPHTGRKLRAVDAPVPPFSGSTAFVRVNRRPTPEAAAQPNS